MGRLYDLSASEIGALVHSHRMGDKILDYVRQFPGLDIQVNLLPITRSILRVELEIYPDFIWSDRNHGTSYWPAYTDQFFLVLYFQSIFLLHHQCPDGRTL